MFLAVFSMLSSAITDIDVTLNGKLLAIAFADSHCEVRSLPSQALVKSIKCPESLTCVTFSPDSKMIAVGGENAFASVYSLDHPDQLWTPKIDTKWTTTGVDFSADGKSIAWSTFAGITLFNASTKVQSARLTIRGNGVYGVYVHSDNHTVIGNGQYLTVWDTKRPEVAGLPAEPRGALATYPNLLGWTVAMASDASRDTLLAASAASPGDGGRAKSLVVVNPKAGKILKFLAKEGPVLKDVAVNPSGDLGAALDEDGWVTTYLVRSGRKLGAKKFDLATKLAFVGSSRSIVVGKANGDIEFWAL
jgi:WD40 repeat protein